MRRAVTIQQERGQIHTVESLTEVFESIASIKIAKLRGRVVASKDFFAELWSTYSSLRVDPKEQLSRSGKITNGRNVFVAVTSEGKLSGEIGNQVIAELLEALKLPSKKDVDIIILGSHGAERLKQLGAEPTQVFTLPEGDEQASVSEIIEVVDQYDQISVFYQTYESIRVQRVARIELVSAVRELSNVAAEDQEEVEIVSSREYIFEPSISEIADFLESLMMGVALNQVLLESKLAQHASRFNAMNSAKHRAREIGGDYDRLYYRAKRAEGDERLKETMKVILAQGQTL